MPGHLLSCNFLDRFKRRVTDYHYEPVVGSEDDEFTSSSVYSDDSRRTSYASEMSSSEQYQNTNQLSDISENEESIHHGMTKRITSQNSLEKIEIFYEIHHGFTSDQVLIIENALQIVADRLFKPEILRNMYQVCGTSSCCLTQGVLSKSNLMQNSIFYNKHAFLHYQLMCLKTQSQNGELPIINIYPVHDNDENKSNNSLPNVFCIAHGSTFLVDGEFEIELNQNKLNGSVRNTSNALFWAGEIVYKMLHNLGHRKNENGYINQSQISVFKQCFLHNGNYLPFKGS